MKKVLIIIVIILLLLFLYGHFVEPNLLKVEEYNITSESIASSFDGFKIIHFSDLLYNENSNEKQLSQIITKINEQNPDIIIFTGDLISQDYKLNDKEEENLISFLSKLDCTLYKYAVIGDNDEKNIDTYKTILDKANFKLLNDNYEYIFYKDNNPIKLIGLTNANNLDELLKNEKNITPIYTIMATHIPDTIKDIKLDNIDLGLAGHYLGGYLTIPFYGSIINKDGAKYYHNNYYIKDNTSIYISNGLGNNKFAFRLFNKAKINLYRLNKV